MSFYKNQIPCFHFYDTVTLFWSLETNSGVFEAIEKINNPVISAISILAGFNVASITV